MTFTAYFAFWSQNGLKNMSENGFLKLIYNSSSLNKENDKRDSGLVPWRQRSAL